MKNITINGKTYKSLIEACEDKDLNIYNISYDTLAIRIHRGEEITEELFRESRQVSVGVRKPVINGKRYTKMEEACKDPILNIHGLTHTTILARVKRGMTLEQAFSVKRGGKVIRE